MDCRDADTAAANFALKVLRVHSDSHNFCGGAKNQCQIKRSVSGKTEFFHFALKILSEKVESYGLNSDIKLVLIRKNF